MDFKRCHNCQHWSRNEWKKRITKIRSWFNPFFWIFLVSRYNIFAEGICQIKIIDKDGINKHIITKGNEKCFFDIDMIRELSEIKKEIRQENNEKSPITKR